jgi:O-antigen ligase
VAQPSLVVLGFLIAATAILLGTTIAGTGLALIGTMFALVLIVLQRPDAATVLVLFAIYSNAAVVAVRFQNVPAIVAAALPVALLAPLAYHVFLRRKPLVLTATLPWMLAFLLAQLLSTAMARNSGDALPEVANFVVEGLGLFILVVNVVRTPGMLRAACWSILAAGAMLGALSAYQELTGTYGNAYFGFAQVKDAAGGFFTGVETLTGRARQPELAGPIGDQNFYAQIMLMLIPIGIGRALAERLPYSVVALGLTMLVGAGMILTFSRGAAVAAAVLAAVMLLIRFIRIRHALVTLAVASLIAFMVPEYVGRVATLDVAGAFFSGDSVVTEADVSLQSRATENLAAGLVFIDYPLLGVGPGQFPSYYQEYANRVGIEVQLANRQPHTLYLGVAAETGALGVLSFLGILLVTLGSLQRARRRVAGIDRDLAITLTSLGLAIGAFMLTGLFLHLAYARYAWLVVALASAGASIALARARETTSEAPTLSSAR